jgi:hypothetical protein
MIDGRHANRMRRLRAEGLGIDAIHRTYPQYRRSQVWALLEPEKYKAHRRRAVRKYYQDRYDGYVDPPATTSGGLSMTDE